MANWIPWSEVRAELMKNPEISKNYDEEYAIFEKEVEAELIAERTRPVFTRTTAKRKSGAFSAKLKRARVTA